MSASTDPLYSPFSLGPVTLKNRFVMAPMTRSRAEAGNVPSSLAPLYYAQRASAGLIVSEGAQVSPQGVGYIRTPGIHTDEQVAGWRAVTEAVHGAGGRIFLQLWHVGRVSHSSLQPGGGAPVAPSAIAAKGQTYTPTGLQDLSLPRPLTVEEIPGVVADFAEGARRAKAAGFDGVEIHGANGYLLDQFLRDGSNARSDAYGGSVENRARFALEVTDAVVAVFGAGRVGYRVSPFVPFNSMVDSQPRVTFGHLAAELGKRKLAYLHVIEPVGAPAEGGRITPELRRAFGGPIILNGGYTHETARAALEAGEGELVSFGVPFLANPDLPERFARGAALNTADRATFYAGEGRGYVDYPLLGHGAAAGASA